MKEKIRIRTAVLIIMMVAGLRASADPEVTISDGVTTIGPISIPGGFGSVNTNLDSSWPTVNISSISTPATGSASAPEFDLTFVAISAGSANPLTVTVSEQNLGPTAGSDNAFVDFLGHTISGSGGAITFNTYYDTNNALNGQTTALTASGTLPGSPYSSSGTNSLSAAAPYSLTEVLTIDGTQQASYSLVSDLNVTNQPCACTISFNCPSNQVICASDPVPDPVAEAATITATDTCKGPVPVTFMGATTNGICPSVITYTFGATSGCGVLSTCSQTITVNCLPACDVTTVSSTIVGTSNLTASVQSAGTGAGYSWSIMNGTITAGQGTSSITYTAGTDTSNPVKVCVTVTSAAGCESTCCASVPVSPQPPTITLGRGDTATIGFWHNKNGQAVIDSAPGSTNLSFWLSSTFPCMLGSLVGDTDAQVASAFETDFGNNGGVGNNDTIQFFGAALASYFTSTTLDGGTNATAGKYGFNQTPGGTGGHTYSIGSNGAAFGVPNNTTLTVLQILQYVDEHECPLTGDSQTILSDINDVLNGINQGGDIN